MSQSPDWEADLFTLSARPASHQALCPLDPPASGALLCWAPDSQHLVAYWHTGTGLGGKSLKMLCFGKDSAAVHEVSSLIRMLSLAPVAAAAHLRPRSCTSGQEAKGAYRGLHKNSAAAVVDVKSQPTALCCSSNIWPAPTPCSGAPAAPCWACISAAVRDTPTGFWC